MTSKAVTRASSTLGAGALLLTAGLVGAPAAQAEEISCTTSLAAVTVDNLRVPDGATCSLSGTTVKGSITVGSAATLLASGIRVVGNVQAEGAALVQVAGPSRVGGSIQIKQGRAASVTGTTVGGDVQYDQNTAALVVADNGVGGNIQVVSNTGGVVVQRNVVDGNLQCKQNSPAPTGSGNRVAGSIEDQCAGMAATPATPATPPPSGGNPAPGTVGQPGQAASVRASATSRRSKLKVDVNPNLGRANWSFRVERLLPDGAWRSVGSYRTKGAKEVRTLNLPRGTYRVVVDPQRSYQGASSAAVFLRR